MKTYYRVQGKNGVYILTEAELERALNRENLGVNGTVLSERAYTGNNNR